MPEHDTTPASIERQDAAEQYAALYDLFYPPEKRDDLQFYLALVLAARSVLDVGCGTGALLRLARAAGHTGRLCGLDPASAMLNQARRRTDIEWVLGDLTAVAWDREFELVVMTGHAFQELIEDDAIRTALAAIRSALTEGGRFAFETRNPLVRGWEQWSTRYAAEVTTPAGLTVRGEVRVEQPVVGEIVRFTGILSSPAWDRPLVSPSRLRFLPAEKLATLLTEAGFVIEEQFGDWDRQPFTAASPEIITIAK